MNSSGDQGPVSEINITPFVDVVLVLLIIFMVTAPMMYNGIGLVLPKTKKSNSLNLSSKTLVLSMNLAGELYLDDRLVEMNDLVIKIKNKLSEIKSDTVYVRAHTNLTYGRVAQLLAFLREKGFTKVALLTNIEKT